METEKSFMRVGYTTVSPYLMVDDVPAQMNFIKNVFLLQPKEGEDIGQNPDGHAEIKIGDTTIMIGQGRAKWPSRQSMNYVYVADVDEICKRAEKFGAKILLQPTDRYYGDRECGFEDLHGNQWWCATYVESLTKEEMNERFKKNKR